MNLTNGTIRVDLDDGEDRRYGTSNGAMPVRQWYHVATSFNGGGRLRLFIDEFMASSDGATPVPNEIPGTSEDWIEIHNRGTSTLSLAGWHLTDNPGSLTKWTFPPGTSLAAGGFLVVFVSGNDAPDLNGNLHTGFKLSAADYDMNTGISQSPEYSARFLEGLRDLPTLSVTGHQDDFFGDSGIYVKTCDRELEAAVSAEYFHPDAAVDGVNIGDGFQIECGLKLQGGASRNPDNAIKHSLSPRFRDLYRAGKLNHPVFEGTTVESFDSIHLRAMCNNFWIHRDANQRARATMIRDQWARDCLIEMGNPDGGQGHFVHLLGTPRGTAHHRDDRRPWYVDGGCHHDFRV